MTNSKKLPPQLYYSLEQAAKEYGCSDDYLIHQGSLEKINLMQQVRMNALVSPFFTQPHDSPAKAIHEFEKLRNNTLFPIKNSDAFLVFFPWSLRDFGLGNSDAASCFYDCLVFDSLGNKINSISDYYLVMLLRIEKETGTKGKLQGLLLREYVDGEINQEIWSGTASVITVDKSKIFILQSELERLISGETLTPQPEQKESEPLIEEAMSILGKIGAKARHREDHAMKAQALEWYAANKNSYSSKDDAAEAITKIVPVKPRTARKWLVNQ